MSSGMRQYKKCPETRIVRRAKTLIVTLQYIRQPDGVHQALLEMKLTALDLQSRTQIRMMVFIILQQSDTAGNTTSASKGIQAGPVARYYRPPPMDLSASTGKKITSEECQR
jgi:hypothetical protein